MEVGLSHRSLGERHDDYYNNHHGRATAPETTSACGTTTPNVASNLHHFNYDVAAAIYDDLAAHNNAAVCLLVHDDSDAGT